MKFAKTLVVALFLICLLIGTFRSVVAQKKQDVAIPDTPAGKVFAEFWNAYNTSDRDVMRQFFLARATQSDPSERQQSADRRTAFIENIYKGYRELNLHSIEGSTNYEIVVLAQSRITEAWCKFEFELDKEPPHAVAIGFTYAAAPASTNSRGRLSQSEIVKGLDAYLRKVLTADMFSGVVLVAKDGKPIANRAYGVANKSSNLPNRIDTRFSLASMSKMFTGVAIAQLAQQGKLSFDDPIVKFLPSYLNRQAAEKVTIHHLLTHTSGIGDYMDKDEFFTARQLAGGRFKSLDNYFTFFADDPLAFEPGKEFRYSSSGYIILGAIIEKASGQNYFDYVTEHIFKPAGMSQTDPRGKTGSPAGSATSTARDLLKFDKSLRKHKLLNAKYTDILLAPKVDSSFGGRYAYGFFVRNMGKDKRIVGHDGESPGVNTQLDMYLDDGYTVIVLSNYDPPAARNASAKLQELITRE
ncbi:MAG TPA: serine hydrolase domain-containing protein [Pyrinomonadaceae bacterium]|nr:serine hydrolase domain-containing protein [Pyrinomonadaceae bacterium]